MIDSISRVAPGSRFAVGSSRNSTSGRSIHARASASRCCSPPDSTRAGRCAIAARPTRRSAARARVDRVAARHARNGEARTAGCRARCGAAARAAGTPSPAAAAAPRRSGCAQRTRPRVGASRPWQTAHQHALAGAVRTEDDRSRPGFEHEIDVVDGSACPPAANVTPARAPAEAAGARVSHDGAARALFRNVRDDVEREHDREQHEAETERQRQVALRCLERDRSRHHARDAVDVAADDHHGADFGDRAPERREHDRHQREAQVVQQRDRGRDGARAERLQLLPILSPRVLDGLPCQRGDQRKDQDRLCNRPSRAA